MAFFRIPTFKPFSISYSDCQIPIKYLHMDNLFGLFWGYDKGNLGGQLVLDRIRIIEFQADCVSQQPTTPTLLRLMEHFD